MIEILIRAGGWMAEHTIVAHPYESTWIMIALILWIAWMGAGKRRA